MAIPLESKPNLVLGVSYAEQKDDAPPGLVWRKVKAGETLGKIADEFGIHWIDLALYNWNTAEPKEINWYLHHFVGCTKNNGMTYSFTGQEKADVGEGGWLLVAGPAAGSEEGSRADRRRGPQRQRHPRHQASSRGGRLALGRKPRAGYGQVALCLFWKRGRLDRNRRRDSARRSKPRAFDLPASLSILTFPPRRREDLPRPAAGPVRGRPTGSPPSFDRDHDEFLRRR